MKRNVDLTQDFTFSGGTGTQRGFGSRWIPWRTFSIGSKKTSKDPVFGIWANCPWKANEYLSRFFLYHCECCGKKMFPWNFAKGCLMDICQECEERMAKENLDGPWKIFRKQKQKESRI